MNPDEAKQLKENYRLDYLESSLDELSSSRVVCYVNGNIPIRECFERTISFIKITAVLRFLHIIRITCWN